MTPPDDDDDEAEIVGELEVRLTDGTVGVIGVSCTDKTVAIHYVLGAQDAMIIMPHPTAGILAEYLLAAIEPDEDPYAVITARPHSQAKN